MLNLRPSHTVQFFIALQVANYGCHTTQYALQLSMHAIALQVARKIAPCDRVFSLQNRFYCIFNLN